MFLEHGESSMTSRLRDTPDQACSNMFDTLRRSINYAQFRLIVTCSTMANIHGLLNRLRLLMSVNVAVLADKLIEDIDVLRLIDTRHISEAIELVHVLFTSLGGVRDGQRRGNSSVLPASVTATLGTSGRSCWVRHMLALANRHELPEDELSKSFRNLISILHVTKRTVADYRRNIRYRGDKQVELIRCVRKLPEAYYTFYNEADTKAVTRAQ
jgi:hypothetical protein